MSYCDMIYYVMSYCDMVYCVMPRRIISYYNIHYCMIWNEVKNQRRNSAPSRPVFTGLGVFVVSGRPRDENEKRRVFFVSGIRKTGTSAGPETKAAPQGRDETLSERAQASRSPASPCGSIFQAVLGLRPYTQLTVCLEFFLIRMSVLLLDQADLMQVIQ